MRDVYIVIAGGCIRFVSSADTNIQIHVVDLDDRAEAEFISAEEAAEIDKNFEQANKLTRLW